MNTPFSFASRTSRVEWGCLQTVQLEIRHIICIHMYACIKMHFCNLRHMFKTGWKGRVLRISRVVEVRIVRDEAQDHSTKLIQMWSHLQRRSFPPNFQSFGCSNDSNGWNFHGQKKQKTKGADRCCCCREVVFLAYMRDFLESSYNNLTITTNNRVNKLRIPV